MTCAQPRLGAQHATARGKLVADEIANQTVRATPLAVAREIPWLVHGQRLSASVTPFINANVIRYATGAEDVNILWAASLGGPRNVKLNCLQRLTLRQMSEQIVRSGS